MSKSKATRGVITERPAHFVQVDKVALGSLAHVAADNPRVMPVMLALLSNMQRNNALVISQKNLASISGCSMRTLARAVVDLKSLNLIQVLNVGEGGAVCAYVVNSRVAWSRKRENMGLALFSADVLVTSRDQPNPDEHNEASPLALFPVQMLVDVQHGADDASREAANV